MRFPRHLARLQPNGYTCGPSALRHALLCYGVRRSLKWIASVCAADSEGTNEVHLRCAARAAGYRLEYAKFATAELARETITWHVRHGHPVLLCVDTATDGPWQHWIAVVGAGAYGVTVADSARPGPVVRKHSWRALMRRLAVWETGKTNRYDVYYLVTAP